MTGIIEWRQGFVLSKGGDGKCEMEVDEVAKRDEANFVKIWTKSQTWAIIVILIDNIFFSTHKWIFLKNFNI